MSKLFMVLLLFGSVQAVASNDLVQLIKERRDQIKKWAPVCREGIYQGQYSESYSSCKQGDLAIFTGLGCLAATLSGDSETIADRCSDVRLSQGSDGRWWRGPTRVDNFELDKNAFSRDQAKGVLAYLVARGTKLNEDKSERNFVQDSAQNWIDWMDNVGKGQMCLKATSNLCTILSSEPHAVLDELGIFPKPFSNTFNKSRTFKHLFSLQPVFWSLPAETALTPKGYQLHLKASTVLIRRALAKASKRSKAEKEILNATAKLLYQMDSRNLYFEFLHKQKVSKDFVRRVFSQCPVELDTEDRYFDWQWQRDMADKPWRHTNGHDCIFMMNLMLAKLNKKI